MWGLTCQRVQCDEIWAFAGAKDKNLAADMHLMPGHLGPASTLWKSILINCKQILYIFP